MQLDESLNNQLGACVRAAIQQYFATLEGTDPSNIYSLVLTEVERPLLETVMHFAKKNQSKAADWLGISRNTLRKLLSKYNLDRESVI